MQIFYVWNINMYANDICKNVGILTNGCLRQKTGMKMLKPAQNCHENAKTKPKTKEKFAFVCLTFSEESIAGN